MLLASLIWMFRNGAMFAAIGPIQSDITSRELTKAALPQRDNEVARSMHRDAGQKMKTVVWLK